MRKTTKDRLMALTLFMYHRILPEMRRDSIPADIFRRQLDYMQSHYTMLPAAEVEDCILGRKKTSGPCAALSFDDAWADNLFYAHEELKKRNLSSFLAVSAGFLHDGPVRSSEEKDVLFRSVDEAREAARSGDFRSFCSRAEIRHMSESGVWVPEVHGTRHEPGDRGVSVLAVPQNGRDADGFRAFLKDDLLHAASELSALTGRKHRMLFWPWGHYSRLSLEVARECGFDIQFTVAKGSIRPGSTEKILPRVGVPPRWNKFVKNCIVFRHPLLTVLHDCFHKEKVCFDDLLPEDPR